MKLYSPQRFEEKFTKALVRGKRLLGDIPLSDKEYQALLSIASNKIKVMRHSGLSLQADLVLAVALVRIGMHAYRDGNYWMMLEETLGLKISASQSQRLGQVFLHTLRTHNLFVWEGSKANKSRYVTNIMIQGIVPDDYLEDFFDFVFAFFDLNLKRDASGKFGTDLAYMMNFIADSLHNDTLSERVSFTDGKTVSVYRLRKATKIAFTEFERRAKSILRTTLKLMDQKYWEGVLPRRPSSRFSKQFLIWSQTSEHFKSYSEEFSRPRSRGEQQYSSPYYRTDLKSGRIYLSIPSQKFKKEDDSGKYEAHVDFGERHLTVGLRPYAIIGGYRSEELEICLTGEEAFAGLSVKILTCNTRLFKLSDQPFLIFNERGIQISQLQAGTNYILASTTLTIESEGLIDRQFFTGYTRYFLELEEDSVVFIDGVPRSPRGHIHDGLQRSGLVTGALVFTDAQVTLPVYRKHPNIVFTTGDQSLMGIGVTVNGKRTRLTDLAHQLYVKTYEVSDGSGRFGVSLALEPLSDSGDGYFEVVLEIPGRHPPMVEKYLYISGLVYEFIGKPYIFSDKAVLSLTGGSGFLPLNSSANGENDYLLELAPERPTADFSIQIAAQEYLLKFTIPYLRWRIGADAWHIDKATDFWHADFRGQLLIDLPAARSLDLRLDQDPDAVLHGEFVLSEGVFKFPIEKYRGRILENRGKHELGIKVDNTWLDFMSVLSKCQVPFVMLTSDFATGEIKGQLDIIGNAPCVADVQCLSTGSTIAGNVPITEGQLIIKTCLEQGRYRVTVYELAEDDFGLVDERTLLYTKELLMIDPSDLSLSEVRIHSIWQRFFVWRLSNRYGIDCLERDSQPGVYKGRLYYLNNRGQKIVCIECNPVLICFPDDGNLTRAYVLGSSEGEWLDLMYDNERRQLVMEESPDIPKRLAYKRYTVLSREDGEFKVEVKRGELYAVQTG